MEVYKANIQVFLISPIPSHSEVVRYVFFQAVFSAYTKIEEIGGGRAAGRVPPTLKNDITLNILRCNFFFFYSTVYPKHSPYQHIHS